MDRTLSAWLGPEIIYLYGTVNGDEATFTLVGEGEWRAVVPKALDDTYVIHLEAYSTNGLEGSYDYIINYGMLPGIIDRTADDVVRKNTLAQKGWASLTPEEQAEWAAGMKGAYSHIDYNRVSHNVSYLATMLGLYGYTTGVISMREDWDVADFPTPEEQTQYITNILLLKEAFYGTQQIPNSMDKLTVTSANNIEKLLLEINAYLNRMVAGFIKCGTSKSGQGVILP